jgi:probable F420-dependent oxidoreductase
MRVTRTALGRVGVWSRELRFQPDRGAARDAAAELDSLGYGALWIPDVGGDVLGAIGEMLDATWSIAVATGILNIWMHDAAEVAAGARGFADADRLLLGLGASHAAVVKAYDKPLSAMREYLDALDAAEPPLPADERIIAALGPKMMDLARDRAGGAHPYLVPVSHTAAAREALGDDRLLAPELSVAFDHDLDAARDRARAHVADYLALPNYANNFLRAGFTDGDLADGGSDHLVDALVAYGDEERIAARVAEHLEAGADHVCIQVVGQRDEALARDAWRRLAPALVSL